MLSPKQPNQQAGYNGIVNVNGEKVKVVGGVAEYDGESYYVSDDGSMVVDKERNLVGYVENGVFKPMDEEHLSALRTKGNLEE